MLGGGAKEKWVLRGVRAMLRTECAFSAGIGSGRFNRSPSVVVILELETSVRMAGDDAEAFGVSGNAPFPPHPANGSTLDKGGLVEVGELDALDDVTMTRKDEAHVVIVKEFADLVGVVDQRLRIFALSGISVHLIPNGEERNVGDDYDWNFFSDPLEVCLEPALLGLVNPSVVVARFRVERDGVEVDKVPSEVRVAVERRLVAKLLDEERFAVFGGIFWKVGKFAPTTDVMISNGVVARDAEVFQAIIEDGPLFCDAVRSGDEGIHHEIAAGDGEGESIGELIDGVDAFFPSRTGFSLGLSMDIGQKREAECACDQWGSGCRVESRG